MGICSVFTLTLILFANLLLRSLFPPVFYNISKLEKVDKIEVIDDKGKILTFEIEKVTSYLYDKFPLQQVFADTSNKRLNLITCDGAWDKATKNYSKRTVIYSILKE